MGAVASEFACGEDAALAAIAAEAVEAVAWLCTGKIMPTSARLIAASPTRVNLWVENRRLISDRPSFLDQFTSHAAQQVGLRHCVASLALGAHRSMLGDVK